MRVRQREGGGWAELGAGRTFCTHFQGNWYSTQRGAESARLGWRGGTRRGFHMQGRFPQRAPHDAYSRPGYTHLLLAREHHLGQGGMPLHPRSFAHVAN